MLRSLVPALVMALLAAGCAVTPTAQTPPANSGPIAVISDHGGYVDDTKSQLFYLAAVDGVPVRTSLQATRAATHGRGLVLSSRYVSHDVPARPVRLRIVGTHVTAAPIQEIGLRLSGEFLSVEGEVQFDPRPGMQYVINGRLSKADSHVCVADAASGECISESIRQVRK